MEGINMFYLAVDKNGDEYMYADKPLREDEKEWIGNGYYELPKGSIADILQYPLTWDDDCQEIKKYENA